MRIVGYLYMAPIAVSLGDLRVDDDVPGHQSHLRPHIHAVVDLPVMVVLKGTWW